MSIVNFLVVAVVFTSTAAVKADTKLFISSTLRLLCARVSHSFIARQMGTQAEETISYSSLGNLIPSLLLPSVVVPPLLSVAWTFTDAKL